MRRPPTSALISVVVCSYVVSSVLSAGAPLLPCPEPLGGVQYVIPSNCSWTSPRPATTAARVASGTHAVPLVLLAGGSPAAGPATGEASGVSLVSALNLVLHTHTCILFR
jgi:hypothetical protein